LTEAMPMTRKYLFDNVFDALKPSKSAAPPPPARRFTEAELNAACESAFAQGREAGSREVESSREQLIARATAAIAEGLQAVTTLNADLERRMTHWALQSALGMVQKLFPELVRRHGQSEIEAMVVNTLQDVEDEPRVVVRMPAAMIETMQPVVAEICRQAGFVGRLLLIEDEAIAMGDCRVEWAEGGIERQAQRLWTDIEQRVARMLAHPTPSDPGSETGR